MWSTTASSKQEPSNSSCSRGSEVPDARSPLLWGFTVRVWVFCPCQAYHCRTRLPDPAESSGSPHQGYGQEGLAHSTSFPPCSFWGTASLLTPFLLPCFLLCHLWEGDSMTSFIVENPKFFHRSNLNLSQNWVENVLLVSVFHKCERDWLSPLGEQSPLLARNKGTTVAHASHWILRTSLLNAEGL